MEEQVPPRLRFPQPPLWVRVSFLVLEHLAGAVAAVAGSPSFKLAWAVVTFVIYLLGKIPFLFRCVQARAAKRVWRDCVYGPRPRNRLDVYFPDPAKVSDGSTYGRAILLFVHGGAWYWGDKLYFSMLQTVSFPDCTVVAINYTLHPNADCDLMVQDISLAIRWTVRHLVNRDFRWWCAHRTPAPLAVVGHSAGAHLAALTLLHRCDLGIKGRGCAVATTTHRRECDAAPWGCSLKCPLARALAMAGSDAYGWSPSDVDCFVGLSGVYQISDHFKHESQRGVADISPMCGDKKTFPPLTPAGQAPPVMGTDRDHWDDFSPTQIVRAQSVLPPTAASSGHGQGIKVRREADQVGLGALPAWFLLHGTEDLTVPVTASVRLFEALKGRGVQQAWLRYVAGGDHAAMLCMDLTEARSPWAPVLASEILHCPLSLLPALRPGRASEPREEEATAEKEGGAWRMEEVGPVPAEAVTGAGVRERGMTPSVAMLVLGLVGSVCVSVLLRNVPPELGGGGGDWGGHVPVAMWTATAWSVAVSWRQEVHLRAWLRKIALRAGHHRSAPL